MEETETRLWDRQKGESGKMHTLFAYYLENRSKSSQIYHDTAAKFGKKWNTINDYAHKYQWRERADAYDEMAAKARIAKHAEDFAEFKESLISMIRAVSYISSARIKSVAKLVADADGNPEAIREAVGNLPLNQLVQSLSTVAELYGSIMDKEKEAAAKLDDSGIQFVFDFGDEVGTEKAKES